MSSHDSHKLLRVGIIGLGIGEAHIPGFAEHPLCEVIALADFSEAKRKEVAARHPGIAVVENADQLLDDPNIDVVSIASFDNFHVEQVIKAINSGKHVFVEKPACLTQDEARQIRASLKNHPEVVISSNLILRKSPRFIDLKKRLADGELGKVSYIEADYNYGRLHKLTDGWRGDIPFYSVVCGGGLHMIDLVQWLTGERICEVSAFANRIHADSTKFAFPDTVAALLHCESGVIIKLTSNFGCVMPHFHVLNVFGTKATFQNDYGDALLYRSRDPQDSPQTIISSYKGMNKWDLIPSFVEAIAEGRKAEVDEEDIFRGLSVCFAIHEALEKNAVVPVEYI